MTAPPALSAGQRVDGFDVIALLGRGEYGEVYRVRRVKDGREFALKRPLLERAPNDAARERREARFYEEGNHWIRVSQTRHPNIVYCEAIWKVGGVVSILAEYIDGGSLEDAIQSRRLYSGSRAVVAERLLDVSLQVALGLQHAHRTGRLHQDLKPANVLITSGGVAKVADFGLTVSADVAKKSLIFQPLGGTSAYAAPEVRRFLRSEDEPALRNSADIWSWAATVLHMYYGGLFWESADLGLKEYLVHPQPDGAIPRMAEDLVLLLTRCLQKVERERPRTFDEVVPRLASIFESVTGRRYERELPEPETPQETGAEAVMPAIRTASGSDDDDGVAAEDAYRTGLRFRTGEDGVSDAAAAMRWLRTAATMGHREAAYVLGLMYDQGEAGRREPQLAATWYEKAGDHADAEYSLGWLHEMGEGVKKSARKASELYRRAAERGHVEAQFSLAQLCMGGRGIDADYEEAFRWYLEAAENGDPYAQYEVGVLYRDGVGTSVSASHASTWLTKAADQNHSGAAYALGCLHLAGGEPERAASWLTRAAELGHVDAMYRVGNMHLSRAAVGATDLERQGVEWLRKAAERGSREAQHALGAAYERGLTVLASADDTSRRSAAMQKAEYWYSKAAEQGLAEAELSLGALLLRQGRTDEGMAHLGRAAVGGEAEAARELAAARRADDIRRLSSDAEAGKTDAQHALARAFEMSGTELDLAQAEHWYQRAAESGHVEAQYRLGQLELKQNRKWEGKMWLARAADGGHAEAASLLRALMAADRIASGRAAGMANAPADTLVAAARSEPLTPEFPKVPLLSKATMEKRAGRSRPQSVSSVGVLMMASGTAFPLGTGSHGVGRDDSNRIVIADATVSSFHARISGGEGGFTIEDLKSTNGTFVNGERVVAPRMLEDGDIVRLSTVVLKFSVQSTRR